MSKVHWIFAGYTSLACVLADLGEACLVHATPYGTQFFRFRIHFHWKVPASEVHAPLMGARPPTGNPGSATDVYSFLETDTVEELSIVNICGEVKLDIVTHGESSL